MRSRAASGTRSTETPSSVACARRSGPTATRLRPAPTTCWSPAPGWVRRQRRRASRGCAARCAACSRRQPPDERARDPPSARRPPAARAVRVDRVAHAAPLQVRAELLALRRGGRAPPRRAARAGAGALASRPLQPLVARWLRPRPDAGRPMIVDVVILQQIEDVLEKVLRFYNDHGISWGWSIVLLTFTVRLAILPLTVKQFRSMVAMQE